MPKTYYKVQFVFSGDFRAILLSGATRIWFVDRHAEYIAALAETAEDPTDVQLIEFDTRSFNPAVNDIAAEGQAPVLEGDGRLVYPDICRYPGVWVEYDGERYLDQRLTCKVEWANG